MTREEAISWIITISEHEGEDIPIYDTDVEAIKTAVSTLRKYQKIEQIMKDIPYGGMATVRRIEEVMEDATD